MNSRRSFIKNTFLAGLATNFLSGNARADTKDKKRSLRIAHITDVHILDKPIAIKCYERVLKEINSMKDKPDFIINTGDTIMDSNKQTRETVQKRWEVWNKLVKENNQLEMKSALGNHDVWYGPDEKLDAEYKKDKQYGKQWAINMLSMPNRYYNFEKNGWHFIALDSINGSDGYQLDDEQFVWLNETLSKIPSSNICVFNHVPIISMGAVLYDTQRKPLKEVKFPSGDMHNDHQKIKNSFYKYKNVKLALSGHVHYIDTIDYLGTKYLCNGAVSGNWWGSPIELDEFPPVYTIVDLFDDGSINYERVYYDYKS